jgi:alpha-glucosidase
MTSTSPWWTDAVVYQVYVRSFADSDGDGIGDLAGLRERLDHLTTLGVDGLWLNPCYPSPQQDHGYDVADYTDIEPAYGTLETFDELLAAAHERGLRLLMDLVPNHCSAQHPWFQAALAAGPGSPERARFLFRDGRGPGGDEPPNNWPSVFGGGAWTRVTEADGRPGQWYLHLFAEGQPDFDWRNPEVGDLFESVLRFWFDRGIDGFRIDVAHGLVKHPELPDMPSGQALAHAPMWNHPDVHAVYRRWRSVADSYAGRDLTLVGEIWLPDVEDLALYLRPDELPQAFYFDLLTHPWQAPALREAIESGITHIAEVGAVVTWTLSNHDVHRTVTRYGQDQSVVIPYSQDPAARTRYDGPVDLAQGRAYARSAILMLLALPGSVYLYQGEELGLPEVLDLPMSARQDPLVTRTGGKDLGRDGCRVPIPWEQDAPTYGFSLTEAPAAPWLPQPDWFGPYAVDVELTDPASFLSLYRRALELRREVWAGPGAALEWVDLPGREPDAFAFRRGSSTCLVNCSAEPIELPAAWGEVVLASAPVDGRTAAPACAVWLTSR